MAAQKYLSATPLMKLGVILHFCINVVALLKNHNFFCTLYVLSLVQVLGQIQGEDWVIPGLEPNFGYGLGLSLNSMGIFGLGTHKVQNFCLRFSDFYLESFSAFSANFFAVKTGFRNKIKSSADIHIYHIDLHFYLRI